MTITDNGRRTVDQLVAEARGMASGGRLPSRTALKTALRIGWETAGEVHERASRSIAAERDARRRESRTALKRLASKRRSGRPVIVTGTPSPTRLNDPAPADVYPAADVDVEDVPGRVEDAPPTVYDSAVPIGPMPATAAADRSEPAAARRRPKSWPVYLLGFGATVAIWSGWVDMGRLTGFGLVHPFPGIPGLDNVELNAAITLPFGMETYGAYALYVWLSGQVPARARRFARVSALGALGLGAAGQVAYHLMAAAGWERAPWPITTAVACLPVAVLGMGAALRHLVHAEEADR